MDAELDRYIRELPKAELHVHLEGTIQPKTLLRLAAKNQLLDTLPTRDLSALADWFNFTDFPHFVQIILAVQNVIRTPADFALVVYECGAAMAEENIRYRELTVSPYNHTHILQKGLTIEDILSGLEEGRQSARRDFGVEMRWVFDVARNFSFVGPDRVYNPEPAEYTLAYALAGRSQGVIALGLGGNEVGNPPEPFAHAFSDAINAGLLSVPHAGETVGPASIWGAVNVLRADRIGHGVRAIEDPRLLLLLQERQIPLEVSLSSNVCLHVYDRVAHHPFPHLDRMGIAVTVNTDDPPLFNTTLNQEYGLLASEFGYGREDIARIARNAYAFSGAEPELKARLLAEFDAWVRSH